ncbi:hypothetical protein GDO78_020401 [Eleutherodactylus coqui]|uniref:Microtubule-associated protein 9 n=1 Tax=Eleutherodactylus coqui TaxID=57060 RepID=A0A8J6EIA7_ELECQ|nr:hypothetical protein GDO78_020401 [Eleutherodactylus coqui]
MDDDDESLNTFLAYTKSPKTAKRTSFQDELKKALSTRVSRQQAVEEAEYSDYSDEFESDDSLDESFGKTKTINSELQKDPQNFPLSDNEEDLYGKTSFLKKSKQAERSFNKHSDKSRSTENLNQGDYENGLSKSEPVDEVPTQQGTDDKERKPIPKPRISRIKSSPSSQGLGISLSDESFMSTQLHSNEPGESSHLEDKAEGKYSSDKPTSLSAPSSLMRLNDKVSASKTQSFSESCSPEGHQPTSPPSPPSLAADTNNKAISKEEKAEMVKDLQIREVAENGNKESNDSGRKSVFEILISDVKEKSLQQETKETTVAKTPENQSFGEKRDNNQKVKQNHGQLDHQKTLKAISELGRSHLNRPFSASQPKKSKASSQVSAKSRYLGTLTILDRSVNEDSGAVEAADKLRATVYQNWLEKKKIFLHELQKNKKAEAQLLKEKAIQENTMKKEEAMAAFRAWRAEKKKEIKLSQQQQRGEEEKKMGELQEIAHKKEECRKAFEKWKEAKEAYLKEKILKEKHTEKEEKRKNQKDITEKKRENMSAIERWNDRKEHVLKEKLKQSVQEKQKLKTLQSEKEEQDKRAMEQYEQWLERKERQEKIQKKQKKLQVILDDDPPPPWSPPGKTIPAGRLL